MFFVICTAAGVENIKSILEVLPIFPKNVGRAAFGQIVFSTANLCFTRNIRRTVPAAFSENDHEIRSGARRSDFVAQVSQEMR